MGLVLYRPPARLGRLALARPQRSRLIRNGNKKGGLRPAFLLRKKAALLAPRGNGVDPVNLERLRYVGTNTVFIVEPGFRLAEDRLGVKRGGPSRGKSFGCSMVFSAACARSGVGDGVIKECANDSPRSACGETAGDAVLGERGFCSSMAAIRFSLSRTRSPAGPGRPAGSSGHAPPRRMLRRPAADRSRSGE
jgi:hypothetical protein